MAEHRTQHKGSPAVERAPAFRRLPADFEEGVVECRATASLSGLREEHAAPFASDPVTRADGPPCTRFTRDSRTT